jgi:CdiI immunity protein
MTSGKKKRGAGTSARDFPALREFFSGYLHQDFPDEYGSAAGAAKAFRNDAGETEIEAVRREWKAWRAGLGKASPDDIAEAARKLGAAWQVERLEDLDHVETALNPK